MWRLMPAILAVLLFAAEAAAQQPIKLDIVDGAVPGSLTGNPGNSDAG